MTAKQDVLDVFNSLSELCPFEFVIAGGAVRDLLHEKPIKDIDVWINLKHNCMPTELLDKLKPKFENFQVKGDLNRYENTTYGCEHKGHKVDLIFDNWHNPIYDNLNSYVGEVLRRFDIGLCRAAIVQDRIFNTPTVVKTREFTFDSLDKTLTILKAGNWTELERTITDHLPRIREKYPDYTVQLGQSIYKGDEVIHG